MHSNRGKSVSIVNLLVVAVYAAILCACSQAQQRSDLACPITDANGSTPPGEQPYELHHGNGQLWSVLWPDGTIVFQPGGPGEIRADGSLAMKFPWWRGEGVRGRIEITGRLLDREGADAYAEIPTGYGETGFHPTAIVFSGEGCWEVTGRVGEAKLTFVQRVLKHEE
jgi:hypothetical protein